ncbi:MAG: hypothetical protein ACI89Z_001536, partial [Porticoccus sp.]
QCGFTVVNVTNCAHVYVGLITFKLLFSHDELSSFGLST